MRSDRLKGNNKERFIWERSRKGSHHVCLTCKSCATLQGGGNPLSWGVLLWGWHLKPLPKGIFRGKTGWLLQKSERNPLSGSVPLEGKGTDVVGRDKRGMGTGKIYPQEGGQDSWANFCRDSCFERVRVEPVSFRIPSPQNLKVPWPFQSKSSTSSTYFCGEPSMSQHWVGPHKRPQRWSLLSGSSQEAGYQELTSKGDPGLLYLPLDLSSVACQASP